MMWISKKFSSLLLALAFLLPSQAHAIFELRGFGGLTFNEPTGLNSRLSSSGIAQIFVLGRYGVDAIIRLPGVPLGVGFRHEWQGIKVDASSTGSQGNEFEVSSTRTAGLISYRFIDKTGYVGLVGTVGVTHKPVIRLKETSGVSDYDSGKSNSGSIGFDGGLHVGGLYFGAEVGYQDYILKEISGPSGTASFDMNFTGFYGQISFGIGF